MSHPHLGARFGRAAHRPQAGDSLTRPFHLPVESLSDPAIRNDSLAEGVTSLAVSDTQQIEFRPSNASDVLEAKKRTENLTFPSVLLDRGDS